MPRIPIITPESDLNAEQKRVLEVLLGRRGGRIPGPYPCPLHNPDVTEYMHPSASSLRLRSSIRCGLSELAIISYGEHLGLRLHLPVHSPNGVKNGLPQSVVEALARGERPSSEGRRRSDLQTTDRALRQARDQRDDARTRESVLRNSRHRRADGPERLHGMVAMQLLAHQMPLPEGMSRRRARQ